jgi:hypothetical protein
MAVSKKRDKYPVGWQMGNPDAIAEEPEERILPRKGQPIRIIINDPFMPESMTAKGEHGEIVQKRDASAAMYRIAATISTSLKFLPLKAVKLSIIKEDTYGIQDYSAFLDVCVRILWRAGVIDCMTGSSVKSVEMTHNKTDRRKVVILVTPLKTREVLIDQLENEAATLI